MKIDWTDEAMQAGVQQYMREPEDGNWRSRLRAALDAAVAAQGCTLLDPGDEAYHARSYENGRRERDEARRASGYLYIGKDGKPILARTLEDHRDALAEENNKLRNALAEAIKMLNEWCEEIDGEGFNNPEWNALLKETQ